jgi:hypothetical protein
MRSLQVQDPQGRHLAAEMISDWGADQLSGKEGLRVLLTKGPRITSERNSDSGMSPEFLDM